jgi:hypothetical protein
MMDRVSCVVIFPFLGGCGSFPRVTPVCLVPFLMDFLFKPSTVSLGMWNAFSISLFKKNASPVTDFFRS